MMMLSAGALGSSFAPRAGARASIRLRSANALRAFASGGDNARSALDESDVKGRFVRTPSLFRNKISKEEGERFPPARDRYHLYVSHACPWANRAAATMRLKKLQDVIGLSVVHPTWQKTCPGQDDHAGWIFKDPSDPPLTPLAGVGSIPCDGCIPDSVNGAKTIRELYELAAQNDLKAGRGDGNPGHKYSVPILWDKVEGTIVNNESEELLRMLNSEFTDFIEGDVPDVCPSGLVEEIEEVNSWVYDNINNGVYKCGFAKSQEAYDEAVEALYKHLDKAEEILSKQRFLCGEQLTEADIRLFMTLVRFDEVYVVYFKCNKKSIADYPNLRNYCRDLYQTPGIGESINMDHIKRHYYTSHPTLNSYAVVPTGPQVLKDLTAPHDRAAMSTTQMLNA
eukprot:CAMPEP_0114504250 /NCGR_PEP_ID=MMETSP0109-20121206/10105_1 /TAXON_ID=29199 /ORGANISM="Chlorarachnion reptans, Strain CCCM449" /LENGTH=395 /DNA_ID=CAMNT_0001682381 /DNA_START=56 /DNA_END=1243 /DNA_ORIENTATION=+